MASSSNSLAADLQRSLTLYDDYGGSYRDRNKGFDDGDGDGYGGSYRDTNKGFDGGGDDYDDYGGSYRDTNKGFDDGGDGRRLLCPIELYERTPKEEILAYYAKVKESEGFDVSDFPNAAVYGNISPISNLSGDQLELVTRLAKSALESYNQNQKQKNQDTNSYKFVKVVMANECLVNGVWYFITSLVVKKRTSSRDSAAARPPQTFQARVFYGPDGVDVNFCRPKPTHPSLSGTIVNGLFEIQPSLSGFASQKPQHHNKAKAKEEPRLCERELRLYYKMLTDSNGFDVPDVANSSESIDIYRSIKSFNTDDAIKMKKLCKLSVDSYNLEHQVKCRYVGFLKANKREGFYGEDYHIELLVKHKNGQYQTLQARIGWDKGQEPRVELCRVKPGDSGHDGNAPEE